MLTDMPYKIVNAIFFNLIIVGFAVLHPFLRVRVADRSILLILVLYDQRE